MKAEIGNTHKSFGYHPLFTLIQQTESTVKKSIYLSYVIHKSIFCEEKLEH